MRNFIFYIVFLISTVSWSQILVINELDANDPSVDDEEFIEIKSTTPNFSLDGYILVFFNGNNTSEGNNLSYLTFDLAGLTTDVNGLLVMGNLSVSPFPQVLLTDGLFQNGADGVAIYQTSINNFPDRTPATDQFNLIDALVYDTGSNSPVDNDLLTALGETTQYFEGSDTTNSIQRKTDGTYESKTPTPRAFNDGTGIIFNAITITTSDDNYNEGDMFTITFTADQNVTTDTNFTINLDNQTFSTADYSGTTNLTILSGQNSTSTSITIIDDTLDEGDEELVIELSGLVEPIVSSNNFVKITVIDNDFTTDPWGTPINPTYNQVLSTQPTGYYDSLIGKSGAALRQAIQDIIADESTVRTHSYADVTDILKQADQTPNNSNKVWLVYTEEERSKNDFQNSSINTGKWNREHTFPRSRGDFDDWGDFDDIATGINTFITTSADSTRHANSDAHALRAADASENSRRSNKHYSNNFSNASGIGEYNGPSNVDLTNNVGVSFRGDVARGVLYLDLRYNGLEIVNGFPTSSGSTNDGKLGDLTTLLQWHQDDVPDDYEMNRNNVVYNWQRNRNPLIDLPDLVDYIWGNRQGEVWMGALSTSDNTFNGFAFYPNPATNTITFENLNVNTKVEVFSMQGQKIKTLKLDINSKANLDLASGVYLLKVKQNDSVSTKHLIIN